MNPNDLLMKAHIESLRKRGQFVVAEKMKSLYEKQRIVKEANEIINSDLSQK